MAWGNIQITPQLVQAVRDALDIIDVASSFIRLQKRGKRYIGLCPFHKEKTPSFSIDPSAGLYYCFGCGAGGDAIKLYMEQSGDDFPAAIESLARRYGIPLPTAPASSGARREPDVGSALEAAADFFRTQLRRNEGARAYLERRRISRELQERYGLGYAPEGWRNLLDALERRVPAAELEAAGLVARSERPGEGGPGRLYDRFRHRLMFPIHSPSGRLVGFGGRTLGDDRAKYVNTSETEQFHKSRLLYGLFQAKRAIRDASKALLVEGYFDVLGAVAAGVEHTVASMGTALTAEQARLLARYGEEVTIGYDGDAAGEKAAQRALPLLLAEGLSVKRARFPEGHDPDSLRLAAGPETVAAAIAAAPDAISLEIERLAPPPQGRTPAEQARIATAALEVLRPVRDPIARQAYTRQAAQVLGVSEGLLASRLGPQLYAPPQNPGRTPEVRSEEEKVLARLLQPETELPTPDLLPPAEVFFDPICRNIYAAFCDLYRNGGGEAPAVAELLSQLGQVNGAVDRLAQLLLQVEGSGEGNLPDSLDRLLRRWRKQRQSDLIRQMRQAEQQGDASRLLQLIDETSALRRTLHPKMTGDP